ncbi:MAG: hypothetical protein EAY75_01340 [Bacteroidetes bacterium]|nr:MAG: hypothetical protein EAY75_01340 [Bacteroidota bacterium]
MPKFPIFAPNYEKVRFLIIFNNNPINFQKSTRITQMIQMTTDFLKTQKISENQPNPRYPRAKKINLFNSFSLTFVKKSITRKLEIQI